MEATQAPPKPKVVLLPVENLERIARICQDAPYKVSAPILEALNNLEIIDRPERAPNALENPIPLVKKLAETARNAKCKCGSGRKFKNCCGSATGTNRLKALPPDPSAPPGSTGNGAHP